MKAKKGILTANWHQKDRSYWQRQLGQYIALNSSRLVVPEKFLHYVHNRLFFTFSYLTGSSPSWI